jgi:hypothetical protein
MVHGLATQSRPLFVRFAPKAVQLLIGGEGRDVPTGDEETMRRVRGVALLLRILTLALSRFRAFRLKLNLAIVLIDLICG